MVTRIEVSTEELIEFVKSKGDSPLNMDKSTTSALDSLDDCGCLFYEYARTKYPDNTIECGTKSATVYNDNRTAIAIFIFPIYWRTWCPLDEEHNKSHYIVHKFSDLVLPT